MKRKLQILGLTCAGLLAISAMAASAVRATPSFTCSSYPCSPASTISEGSKATFTNPEEFAWFSCDASYVVNEYGKSGIGLEVPDSRVTLTPHYTNCTIVETLYPTFEARGCDYVLTAGSRLSAGHYSHSMDIACPPEGSMKFSAATCEAVIPPQTGLGPVTTVNSSGSTVTLDINVDLTFQVTKDGFLCGMFNGLGYITRGYDDHVFLTGSGFQVSGE